MKKLIAAVCALVMFHCGEQALEKTDAGNLPDGAAPDASVPDGSLPDGGGEPAKPELIFRFGVDGALSSFLDVPFPTDLRRNEDGTIDLSDFPNPTNSKLLSDVVGMIEGVAKGFGLNSAIYFAFGAPLDTSTFPRSAAETLDPDSPVFLVNVGPAHAGEKVPLRLKFFRKATYYLPANTLAALPLWGFPLRGGEPYACIVMKSLQAADGSPIGPSEHWSRLAAADPSVPARVTQAYAPLFDYLRSAGIAIDEVAGAAVFTTQAVLPELDAIKAVVDATEQPSASGIAEAATSADCVVYEGTFGIPQFQRGDPPFEEEGSGQIVFDADGRPVIQRNEEVRFAVSIPVWKMPDSGWPVILYAHGTGGDYMTFVSEDLADKLCRMRIAMLSIDGLLNGARTPEGETPELSFFNVNNLLAFRDNPRQGGADYFQVARFAKRFMIPAHAASSGREERFDPEKMYYFGHSQGGITGAIFIAADTNVKAALLSGAGGVVAAAVLERKDPVDIKALVEAMLRLGSREDLDEFHPVINLTQAGGEPSDPVNYGIRFFVEPPAGVPKDVLQTEGLLDPYTPAHTAEALAISAHMPIVKPLARDLEGLKILGLSPLDPPVFENVRSLGGAKATAGLSQYPDDGHYPVFDNDDAIMRWEWFFKTLVEDGRATIK